MDIGLGGKLGLDMLQVQLPAEFLVQYHAQNMQGNARMDCGGGQEEGAGTVILCHCLGEVHNGILLWDKQGPMPLGQLHAALVDSLLHSAVLICRLAICQGFHVVNKVGS